MKNTKFSKMFCCLSKSNSNDRTKNTELEVITVRWITDHGECYDELNFYWWFDFDSLLQIGYDQLNDFTCRQREIVKLTKKIDRKIIIPPLDIVRTLLGSGYTDTSDIAFDDQKFHDNTIELLWQEFKSIPVAFKNLELVLDQDWFLFKKGSSVEKVLWSWFDRNYSLGIYFLMNEYIAPKEEVFTYDELTKAYKEAARNQVINFYKDTLLFEPDIDNNVVEDFCMRTKWIVQNDGKLKCNFCKK